MRLRGAYLGFAAAVAVSGILLMGLTMPASAAVSPYLFEPKLSLTGDCTTSAADPDPDPSCPYAAPPAGPTGRFADPRSITTDFYGNEYVASYDEGGEDRRIDVFDDEGHFISELAEPKGPRSLAVDSEGNLYVHAVESKEIVRYSPSVYEPAAGNIEYGNPRVVIGTLPLNLFGGLAIDRLTDQLFVANGSDVRKYASATEGNGLLATIENPSFSWAHWAAVDAQRRRLFVSSCVNPTKDCGILVLEADPPYALLEELDETETSPGRFLSTKGWLSTAVDEESGHFFVEDLEATKNVYEFDEEFKLFSTLKFAAFEGGNALQIGFANTPLDPAARNIGYLFVPAQPSFNSAYAFKPPAVTPPDVKGPGASGISETEALLGATIDPRGGQTEYMIEYVTEAQFASTEFEAAVLVGKGTIPGSVLPRKVSAPLLGLSPGTAYRFRVRASNEAGEDEEEAGFSTYSDAPASESCPNQALRNGASAHLPDCRAYELVTPPDTNGHPTISAGFPSANSFSTLQASPSGGSLSFIVTGGTIPGLEGTGSFEGDPYLASRGASSWGTSAVGPNGVETTAGQPGGVSPDQGYRFWTASVSGSALVEGKQTQYVRYPDGHSELIGRGSLGSDPAAKGVLITEGGDHIVFRTDPFAEPVQLEPDAPPDGIPAVYDRTADEVTHVVSLLPGDITPSEQTYYVGASKDGKGIAFKTGLLTTTKYSLYLRVDNSATYHVGDEVTLAGVAEGGERVFYVKEGDLLAFDTDTEAVVPFTESGDATVVNVASGGSRAYFVSPSVLTGEANPNGATAQPGKQNLYLSEEGSLRFVATVTDRDVEGEAEGPFDPVDGLGLWTEALGNQVLARDPSRLTPSGSVMLFQSRANLDGHETGGAAQIFRYDSVGGRLHCISCNPTGDVAGEGARLQSEGLKLESFPVGSFAFVPGIRADGRRAFFESTEALVSADTDNRRDVYEWEENGVGSCTRPDGCVYLISSGHSERDNYLYAHSASGNDVFFQSGDVLAGSDAGGTPSIYDARVNGGFAEEVDSPCAGEACKPALTPPPFLTPPQSGATSLSGNITPSRGKRCPKGKRKVKRKGKVHCVKKKRKKNRRYRKHHRRNATNGKGRSK